MCLKLLAWLFDAVTLATAAAASPSTLCLRPLELSPTSASSGRLVMKAKLPLSTALIVCEVEEAIEVTGEATSSEDVAGLASGSDDNFLRVLGLLIGQSQPFDRLCALCFTIKQQSTISVQAISKLDLLLLRKTRNHLEKSYLPILFADCYVANCAFRPTIATRLPGC